MAKFGNNASVFLFSWRDKGRMAPPKRMNLRKNSKRPLTPPPHFRKIILRILRQKCVISRRKCVCSFWQDCYIINYPISRFLYHFHAEKVIFKGPKLQYKFLVPPPLELFPKFISFGGPSVPNSS